MQHRIPTFGLQAALHADSVALAAFARRKWKVAAVASLIAGAIAAAILIADYRFMLLAIVALVVPLVGLIDAWATSKAARDNGFALVELHPEGVLLRTRAGETRSAYGATTAFRAGRDVIVVALSIQGRWRRWEVPAAPEAVQGFVDALRARGITVAPEVGLGSLAGFLAGAVVARVAAVVATGLVLGALANIVLAVTDRGGSLPLGFACLGGAVLCLTVVVLFRTAVADIRTQR